MTLKLLSRPKVELIAYLPVLVITWQLHSIDFWFLELLFMSWSFCICLTLWKRKGIFEWSPVSLPFHFFSCYFIQYKSLPLPTVCVCARMCIACMSLCIYLCSCTLTWSPDQDVGCHSLLCFVVFPQERVSLSPKLAVLAGLLASKFSRPFCLCSPMVSLQVCIAMSYFF